MDQLLSNYPDPSLALDGVIDCLNDASFNYPDPSLLLERVIGCLDEALRSFAEGDEGQAFQSLAEANIALESCEAAVKSDSEGASIAKVDGPSTRPVEREGTPLTRAASA